MARMQGKVAAITGGAGGIGGATVRRFLEEGGQVAFCDTDGEKGVAFEKALATKDAFFMPADVSRDVEAARFVEQVVSRYGRIDVLVNNAGVYEAAPLEAPLKAWRETWDRVLRINLLSPAELCRHAILDFRTWGGGKIINIASRAAFRGESPDQMPYGASKGALVTLTKTIARGYAADGVLAFAIAPGFTETEMVTEQLDAEAIRRLSAAIPLGSMVQPEEIGSLTAFLCCDAVRHLTGATFDVNGASYVR